MDDSKVCIIIGDRTLTLSPMTDVELIERMLVIDSEINNRIESFIENSFQFKEIAIPMKSLREALEKMIEENKETFKSKLQVPVYGPVRSRGKGKYHRT